MWFRLFRSSAVVAAVSALAGANSATAALPDFTWKGAAADPRWSVDENWLAGAAPAPGAAVGTLAFGPESPLTCTGFACITLENDITGLTAHTLAITDSRVKLTGSGIALGAGGLHATYTTSLSQGVIASPIALAADQTWTVARPIDAQEYPNAGFLQVQGALSGSHALSVQLDANSYIAFNGDPSDVGPITFEAPPSQLGTGHNRILPRQAQVYTSLNAVSGAPITVKHTMLETTGALGPVKLHDAGLHIWWPGGVGVATAAGLKMDATSHFSINILGDGTTRGVDYSSLTATGPVSLAGQIRLIAGTVDRCFKPRVGDSYTLISTTGALTGTFEGDVSADRESIYPGYGCPDASDRQLEFRYDRTSMPRTVKLVVVPTTDPTPTTPAATTPAPLQSVAQPAQPAAPSGTAPAPQPVVASGLYFEAPTLRFTKVPIKLKRGGKCPKRVTVSISSGKTVTVKRLKTKRNGNVCRIESKIKLKGKLAAAAKLRVKVSGDGVKSTTKSVKRTA